MSIGRLLGIDHGLARIGLAVSDATGTIARELGIVRRTSKAEDFAQINRVIREQQVVALVVGLPANYEAAPGTFTQADKVRNWVDHLTQATPLPIVLWDEQLTSVDAEALARQKRRKPGAPIDDLAARLMLQSYLDALRDGLAALPNPPTPPPSAV
jgi:putative Holliday junction resolvase